MIKNKIVYFPKLTFICLELSALFFIARTLNETEFITFNYYKSFSASRECFIIHHNNPNGPRFLIGHIEYDLISNESVIALKNVVKKYQLKLINRPCENSFTLPNLRENYNRMNLSVRLYLYYEEEPMALSIYNFNKGFNSIPFLIVTVKNNFGLQVQFSDIVDENNITDDKNLSEVKSYLRVLDKNNSLICVVTPNNPQLVLWSEGIPFRNDEIVTRIRIEKIKNEIIDLTEDYPAFGCNKNDYFIESVYLISEGYAKIHVSLISSIIDTVYPISRISQTIFWNLNLINISRMMFLPINSKKIFIIRKRKIRYYSQNNITINILISESDIPYLEKANQMVEIRNGVRRKKWYYHISSSSHE